MNHKQDQAAGKDEVVQVRTRNYAKKRDCERERGCTVGRLVPNRRAFTAAAAQPRDPDQHVKPYRVDYSRSLG